MANPTTFDYVSERRLLYFTQALKAKIPEAGAVIDDTVAALNKVYSSSKVESLITSATGAMIDDTTASTSKVYSSSKTEAVATAAAGSLIDDTNATATNKTYSASKIENVAATAASGIINDTNPSATDKAYSASKTEAVATAAAGALIDDTAAANNKTYSSTKIEQVATAAAGAIIDDTTSTTTKTYSSSKIDALIADIIDDSSTTGTDVTWSANKLYSAFSAITGIDFQVVQTLPATGVKGVIYLMANSGSAPNVYDEYIWIDSDQKFEKIGSTEVNLDDYVKKTDMVEITTAQIDTIIDTVWPPATNPSTGS